MSFKKQKLVIPAFAAKKPVEEVLSAEYESSKPQYEEPIIKKEVIPLWQKWTRDALLEKRMTMGSREFDRGYRQRAISDDDLLFKAEWVDKALDRSLVIPDSVTRQSYWAKFPRDAGVDLAIASAVKEAAFFSLMGIMTTKDWHRWVMNLEFTRGLTFGQQTGVILQAQDRFQYDIVTVESNAYQESLVRHFQEEGVIGRVPIRGFHTGRIQKVDMELGVPAMAVEFEQNRWHIPYGDGRSRRIMEPFIEELKTYPLPGFHDDAVMSCFFARESRRMGSGRANIHIIGW